MCKIYKIFGWCSLLLLLCLPLKSYALDTFEFGCESAKVGWNAGDDLVQWHDIRTVWKDGTELQYSDIFSVIMPKLTAVIPRLRSGHSYLEIRACMNIENPVCSVWKSSEEIGTPNPWEVYWKPLPPGNIIIE